MAEPINEFHLFPNMPTELRRAVWKLCLPRRRIIEIGTPLILMAEHDVFIRCPTNLNDRPPIITRVCREARAVALESGGIVASLGPGDNNPSPRRWINPATDIVIHWGSPTDIEYNGYRKTQWVSLNGLGVLMYVSRGPELNSWWRPWPSAYIPDRVSALDFQRDCIVTWVAIPIHVTIEQAASSGLFGMLVEERVQIVDRFDMETISKYRQLWELGTCQTRPECRIFDILQNPKSLSYHRKKERDDAYNLQLGWLQYRWELEEHKATHLNEDVQEEVGQIDAHIFGWRGGPVRCEEDNSPRTVHPWIKNELKKVPRFITFGVMFRFCEHNCDTTISGQFDAQREICGLTSIL